MNPRDATLERIAVRRIEADRLIPEESTVLVGVSGGPDSVALVHFLAAERVRTGRPAAIAMGHVNHALRGADSDLDAAFARELAGRLGVAHFETSLPPGALVAARDPLGLAPSKDALAPEERARRLRYEALGMLAARAGADLVAVAHTADDQAETVLFRMARGAGLRGLGGMVSGARIHGVRLIRPLLDVTREQVMAYLTRQGMAYREDGSNASLAASRNYIRHEVLPRLRERVNPAIRDALVREADLFREADGYFEAEAQRVLPGVVMASEPGKIVLEAARLAQYPKLLRSYIFRCVLHGLDGVAREFSAAHVDALQSLVTQSRGRSVDFPGGIKAKREQRRIVLTSRNREPAANNLDPTKERSGVETSGLPADSMKGSPAE